MSEKPLLIYTRSIDGRLELVIAPGDHTCVVYEMAPELAFKLAVDILNHVRYHNVIGTRG